ncbi:CDP-diacylglycerol--inositol 3-phosphatidyltransferase 1-like [Gigantopelta aegis]|uniref:CDP-diacylglycerol--inositol 3-phosphatidyltransferase 1-like n=1 Tax=Gigantopelta aegis TaxID=1735272 RepID=UPI001B887957|nr:CDP-diacylglycerol--inositol 3-phosphatidyltransferase 1-like [Gigantopelta aegis]
MGLDILFYAPNIIGYIRIILASLAFVLYTQPLHFVILYAISISLDAVDGIVARRLNQTSAFGAWFDVVIDLYGRGLLWCRLYSWGYLEVMFEWMTFLSTHVKGPNWKRTEKDFPKIVVMVMANGFKTPMGFLAVGSLHILPLWLYCYEMNFFTQTLLMPVWMQLAGIAVLTVGRVVCFSVELFYLIFYLKQLLHQDDK